MRNISCKICNKIFLTNKKGLVLTCSSKCSLKNQRAESLDWGYKHRSRLAELAREYYRKNPIVREKLRKEALRRYYVYKKLNPERIREINRLARKRYEAKPINKLKKRLLVHNRRLDKKVFMNIELWLNLVKKLKNKCQGCFKTFPLKKLEIDHIVPISKGGVGTIDNLQPLCRSCNARKGAKISRRTARKV